MTNKLYGSLRVASTMIFLAVANANGVISETEFDIGFYGLLASSVVMISGGKCRLPFAR